MTKSDLKIYLEKHASKEGFKLNSNTKILNLLLDGLLSRKKHLGELYCPCRIDKNESTICPCIYHEKEIRERGICHCHLFVK